MNKEVKEVSISEDWPFVVVHISERRWSVAKSIYYYKRAANYRGLGFYSLQIVGDKVCRLTVTNRSNGGVRLNTTRKRGTQRWLMKVQGIMARSLRAAPKRSWIICLVESRI